MRAKPSKLLAAAKDLLERQAKLTLQANKPRGFQQAKANPGPTALQRPEPGKSDPYAPGDKTAQ